MSTGRPTCAEIAQRFLAEMELIDLSIGFVAKTSFVQVLIGKRSEHGTDGTPTATPVTWAPRKDTLLIICTFLLQHRFTAASMQNRQWPPLIRLRGS